MFSRTYSCVVCQKKVSDVDVIRNYQSVFCSTACVKQYEELLRKAKNVSLDDCCS